VLKFSRENLEERGLARSVCPDDAVTVTGGEFEVDVLEKGFIAEGETEVGYCNHIAQDSGKRDCLQLTVCSRSPLYLPFGIEI